MNIQVLILAYNEERMMPYTLRHYTTFADRITVFDGISTDRTREICRQFGAKIVDFKTNGLNDMMNRHAKNTGWINDHKSDWVICVDTDEIVYFPKGAKETLAEYDAQKVALAKTTGFEMFSDSLPTTSGQIYDEIKMGAKDERWYSKPILFSPRRIRSIDFSAGAHTATAISIDGEHIPNPTVPNDPPAYLLHYHQIGPIEHIAARYDATRARLSPENVKNRHGNFDPGMKHAQDKRAMIFKSLQQVIA